MLRLKSLLESVLPPKGVVTKQLFDYILSQVEVEASNTVVKNWKQFTPQVCNNGWCDLFAERLQQFLPTSEMWHTQDSRMGTYGHVWILWKGKCYDPETLQGVTSWKQLPWMQRFYKKVGSYPHTSVLD